MEASTLTHASRRGLLARRSPLMRLHGDERLVAMIRGGQDGAFEILFERYQARLLGFCRHMLGSLQDAEDVLQEVFVAAYNAMLADTRQINVRPWLYRIARNRCLNHLRRPVADGQDSMDVLPHEGGATTHERVQTREDFRHLIADIGELPETQRTALLLREIDAMSYEDIAQAMDTTVPSVKSLLVRARIALAEAGQARMLTCGDVRLELAEAAAGVAKASGPVRRHVRECEDCKDFRHQLRSDTRALAALFPIGPMIALKALAAKLGIAKASGAGATGAAGGGSAISGALGGAGGTAGVGGIGGLIGAKAAAGLATAVLVAASAVEVKKVTAPSGDKASVTAASDAPQPVVAPPAVARLESDHHRTAPKAEPAAVVAEPAKPAAAPAATKPAQPAPHPAAAPTQPAEQPPSDTGTTDTAGDGTSGGDPAIGTTVTTDPANGDPGSGDPSAGNGDPSTGGEPGTVSDSVPTTF